MRYKWIDTSRFPCLSASDRLVLFGAGQGSVEFLEYLKESGLALEVVAIADNDASMHGKELQGVPILAPARIPEIAFNRILVTTISGRESVANQLVGLGYAQDCDFYCIGRYPSQVGAKLDILHDLLAKAPFLQPGQRILHVGPGGFLGLECSLFAQGFQTVSMDAYGFGIQYPEVTDRVDEYDASLTALLSHVTLPTLDTIRKKYNDLFRKEDNKVFIDTDKIPYLYPHRFSNIPLADASVDAVLSFAVLEHVRNPDKSIQEMRRVLKPGGISVHRIITRDHRSFSQVAGYHPFSYLEYSEDEWNALNSNKFYQNRILPRQWREKFPANEFHLLYYQALEKHILDSHVRDALLASNSNLTENDLLDVNCDIIARKN